MKRRRELSDAKCREIAVDLLGKRELDQYEQLCAEFENIPDLGRYLADHIGHEQENMDYPENLSEIIAEGIAAYESIHEGRWEFVDAN